MNWTPAASDERTGNLFAAFTPGHDDLFGDAPTLVNTMPTLFNAYFGTTLPLSPDVSVVWNGRFDFAGSSPGPGGLTGTIRACPPSVYSAGHDPRVRRAPSRRRRPVVRRPPCEPARAGPEHHDPDRVLGSRVGAGSQQAAHGLPARGARVRLEGDVARHRGVQSSAHPRRLSRRRRWCRRGPPTPDGSEATQADADAAAKRFWQRASWYRRASIRAESLAGQPVMDDLSTQGAVLTEDVVEAAAAGDIDGAAPGRGRAVLVLRRGLDRVPRPARRGLPRLRGRRAAPRRAAAGRRRAVRAPPPGDRAARAAEGVLAARVSATTSTTSSAARSASGSSARRDGG